MILPNFEWKNEALQDPFPKCRDKDWDGELFLSKNRGSAVPLQEVILKIQKDVQNYKRCVRKSYRELNISSQENRNNSLLLRVREPIKDVAGKEKEKAKKEGTTFKGLFRSRVFKLALTFACLFFQ